MVFEVDKAKYLKLIYDLSLCLPNGANSLFISLTFLFTNNYIELISQFFLFTFSIIFLII